MHINIEIKAKCCDSNKIRDLLKNQNAEFKGLDHQIDTYFKTHSGRLKLRVGNIENYLIYYEREDEEGPKQSEIILLETLPNTNLEEILTKALTILTIVDKEREIYFIDNVKFHIDDVKNLGNFIEIEATDYNGNFGEEKLFEQCREYMELFGIKEEYLIKHSYSDLLIIK
jgi:predicted adenylyl cyclase CyaB